MNDDHEELRLGSVGTATGEAPTQPLGSVATTTGEAPTQPLGLTAAGDRCVVCGTPLSSDQRYCVNCGERRSQPRFSLPAAASAAEPVPAPRRPPRRPRAPAGATLVAGVGTLLLAMGVGVLIGRTNHGAAAPAATPKAQVIYLNGNGSGSNTNTVASATSAKTSNSKPAKSKSKAKPKSSAATAKKANAAASKVLGSSAANLPPATVTVGAAGHGPGYENGHFTGTFFGH